MAQFPDGDIYAGLTGLDLEGDEIDLGEGIILRRTYAHLSAPILMAFGRVRPEKPHLSQVAHLAPWKAAYGGFAFDLAAELVVPKRLRTSLNERIELARFLVALMRIWTSPSVTIPVLSNVSFSDAAKIPDNETHFFPIEIEPRYFALEAPEGASINEARLLWVKENWRKAADLAARHGELRLAIDAIDRGQFIQNYALTLLSLWGALEALFSPARVELRFRVATLIASYLHEPGPARYQLYNKILKLYDQRSAAAHGQPKDDTESLLATFELLRQAVLKMIGERHVPTKNELEALLFGVSETSGEAAPMKEGPVPT